ncbi:hypothetical protein EXIGLDRAFT_828044 [Exidia glandulosa HHB12029]|uniref:Small ribosomal subunit protein bS18m n=1 Tax=Exidia glandulosa HHB12029 TaxID=1314781 RepID=A0A165QV80_EXIGL|nr:hypothetical protein EXIGLDRAFT_828044 [Exidia glandulosa HHB12029]
MATPIRRLASSQIGQQLLATVKEAPSTSKIVRPTTSVSTSVVQEPKLRPTFLHNEFYHASDFLRNKPRRMYTPFTRYRRLGPGSRESHEKDPFIQLEIDPVREFENTALLNHFMTRMGKIKTRLETNLSWKSQRKVGKAIRRAKAMGIIPQQSRTLEDMRMHSYYY